MCWKYKTLFYKGLSGFSLYFERCTASVPTQTKKFYLIWTQNQITTPKFEKINPCWWSYEKILYYVLYFLCRKMSIFIFTCLYIDESYHLESEIKIQFILPKHTVIIQQHFLKFDATHTKKTLKGFKGWKMDFSKEILQRKVKLILPGKRSLLLMLCMGILTSSFFFASKKSYFLHNFYFWCIFK